MLEQRLPHFGTGALLRPEQHEVRAAGPEVDGHLGERSLDALALADDVRDSRLHVVDEAQGKATGDLFGGVEVVGQGDLVQLGDEPRGADQVAEPGARHRPGLAERAGHHQRRVLVHQADRRPVGELAVGLVYHHQAGRDVHDGAHVGLRLHQPGGVVRRAEEGDDRVGSGAHPAHLVEVQGEVAASLSFDHRRTRDPGDVAVELIGGLEGRHRAAGAGEGEQQRLQDLVGAVGREDLRRFHAVQGGDRLTQRRRGAIGIPVPLEAGELSRERILPSGRRRGG